MTGKTNEENFYDLYHIKTFTEDPASYTSSKEFKESYPSFSSDFKLETLQTVTEDSIKK
jgi:hypothetical protein